MQNILTAIAALVLATGAGPASMTADEAYARAVTYFEGRFNRMAAEAAEKNALQVAEARNLKAELAAAKRELSALRVQAAAADDKASEALAAFAAGDADAGLDAIEAGARANAEQALAQWKRLGALAFPIDTDRAIAAFETAQKLAPGDPAVIQSLARLYLRQGRPAEAAALSQKLLESTDPALKAQGYLLSGDAFAERGMLLQAQAQYQEALAQAATAKDGAAQGAALARLGRTSRTLGQLPAAEGYLKQGLERLRAAGDKEGEAAALMALGATMAERKATALAEAQQKEALALYETLDDRPGQAAALAALGETARLQGFAQIAEGHLRRALKLARALEAKTLQARITLGLGQTAEARKAPAEACLQYRQAAGLFVQAGAGQGPELKSAEAGVKANCR